MPIEYPENFNELWQIYPRKVGKLAAFKQYTKSIKLGVTHEELVAGVRKFADHARGTEERFIPHFRTYLYQGRWEDELQGTSNASGKTSGATAYERAIIAGVVQSVH